MRTPNKFRIRSIRENLNGLSNELDYHLLLSRDLGFLEAETYERAVRSLIEVRKMLASLLSTVEIEAQTRVKAAAKG